jgi:hypothetical protein
MFQIGYGGHDAAGRLGSYTVGWCAMPTLFDKLNLKVQQEILVLNSPDTFEKELGSLGEVRVGRRIEQVKGCEFALVFVTQRARDSAAGEGARSEGEGRCAVVVCLSERHVKEIQMRLQPGRRVGAAAEAGVRHRSPSGD